MSAQLLSTLTGAGGSGPAVQSVELAVNGKPWSPPGSNPEPGAAAASEHEYTPAYGASSQFYYVDSAGDLPSRASSASKPVKVAAHRHRLHPDRGLAGRQYLAAL